MDLKKFNELSEAPLPRRGLVWQDWAEWKTFLEFAEGYFKARGIEHPIIVEIGVMHNEQREFYRELLGAEHIGIDININNMPDILGDSAAPATVEKVQARLDDRPIDLLFIDGNHTADGIKADYEIYGPLTRSLIAIHDINAATTHISPVKAFWNEVVLANGYVTAIFHRCGSEVSLKENRFVNQGIGVIIKG